MKKSMIYIAAALITLSSCSTTEGGAYNGAMFGSVLGSAIGGIVGGPRGSDLGTIVGMAGGAVTGAAVGSAKEQQRREDYEQYQYDKAQRAAARRQRQQSQSSYNYENNFGSYGSGFDSSNSADDRIYDFTSPEYTGSYSTQQPQTAMQSRVEGLGSTLNYSPAIEIRNARFIDDSHDGQIQRGEMSKIIFEVYNTSQQVIYDVVPTVVETSGMKQIYISPSMHIENIYPGKGIRYTALVKAGTRLKNSQANFQLSVIQGGEAISKVTEFNIPTSK